MSNLSANALERRPKTHEEMRRNAALQDTVGVPDKYQSEEQKLRADLTVTAASCFRVREKHRIPRSFRQSLPRHRISAFLAQVNLRRRRLHLWAGHRRIILHKSGQAPAPTVKPASDRPSRTPHAPSHVVERQLIQIEEPNGPCLMGWEPLERILDLQPQQRWFASLWLELRLFETRQRCALAPAQGVGFIPHNHLHPGSDTSRFAQLAHVLADLEQRGGNGVLGILIVTQLSVG